VAKDLTISSEYKKRGEKSVVGSFTNITAKKQKQKAPIGAKRKRDSSDSE